MSDYSKSTNFTAKDGLSSGDPNKRINGSLFDAEFDPIATAVASKVDKVAGETGELAQFTSSGQLESAGVSLAGIYPVGSIYMNASVSTNPATLFGFGTWVVFGAGRVPVGIDSSDVDFDASEETGGSKTTAISTTTDSHTLTIAQMPSHDHDLITGRNDDGASHNSGSVAGHVGNQYTASYNVGRSWIGNEGGGGGHTHGFSSTDTNLQPYIVVRMWKRTA